MKKAKIKTFSEGSLVFLHSVCVFHNCEVQKKYVAVSLHSERPLSLPGHGLVKTPVKGYFLHLWSPSLTNNLKDRLYMF